MAFFPGTAGYNYLSGSQVSASEGLDFDDVNPGLRPLLPKVSGKILDVGAGIGRDTLIFAELGHQVVAIEPIDAARHFGMKKTANLPVEWLGDGLPRLERVQSNDFNFIHLQAVWMHLSLSERQMGMNRLGEIAKPAAGMYVSLRHGPVPEGRIMYPVEADEVIAQAGEISFQLIKRIDHRASILNQPGVTFSHLHFRRG